MMKMNLRDFSVQLCVLKKTNGSFRSHQVCGTQKNLKKNFFRGNFGSLKGRDYAG